MKHHRRILNVGYLGRSVDGLCATLRDAGVDVLVDVRARAWSQRPEFRKTALSDALRANQIDYFHCKVAGNPFRNADDWRICRGLYAQHIRAHPDIMVAVEDAIRARTAALFCYEAERTSCHRDVIIAFLRSRHANVSIIDL